MMSTPAPPAPPSPPPEFLPSAQKFCLPVPSLGLRGHHAAWSRQSSISTSINVKGQRTSAPTKISTFTATSPSNQSTLMKSAQTPQHFASQKSMTHNDVNDNQTSNSNHNNSNLGKHNKNNNSRNDSNHDTDFRTPFLRSASLAPIGSGRRGDDSRMQHFHIFSKNCNNKTPSHFFSPQQKHHNQQQQAHDQQEEQAHRELQPQLALPPGIPFARRSVSVLDHPTKKVSLSSSLHESCLSAASPTPPAPVAFKFARPAFGRQGITSTAVATPTTELSTESPTCYQLNRVDSRFSFHHRSPSNEPYPHSSIPSLSPSPWVSSSSQRPHDDELYASLHHGPLHRFGGHDASPWPGPGQSISPTSKEFSEIPPSKKIHLDDSGSSRDNEEMTALKKEMMELQEQEEVAATGIMNELCEHTNDALTEVAHLLSERHLQFSNEVNSRIDEIKTICASQKKESMKISSFVEGVTALYKNAFACSFPAP